MKTTTKAPGTRETTTTTTKREEKKTMKTTTKAPFDYSQFGMNSEEFKKLSFGMFIGIVSLMDGTTDLLPFIHCNKKDFARFNIELTEETVTRVLIPAITKVIKKNRETRLSLVTFKTLLKGGFNDRLTYEVTHKAKAPTTKAPKAKTISKTEQNRIEKLVKERNA